MYTIYVCLYVCIPTYIRFLDCLRWRDDVSPGRWRALARRSRRGRRAPGYADRHGGPRSGGFGGSCLQCVKVRIYFCEVNFLKYNVIDEMNRRKVIWKMFFFMRIQFNYWLYTSYALLNYSHGIWSFVRNSIGIFFLFWHPFFWERKSVTTCT